MLNLDQRQLVETIEKAVLHNKNIKIRFYEVNEEIGKKIEFILKQVLEFYGRPDLLAVIYTCLKELITNASKANYIHIYHELPEFGEKSVKNIIHFKEIFKEKGIHFFSNLAKAKSLGVEVHLTLSFNSFRFRVLNDAPLSDYGKQRIKEKFYTAKNYPNFAEFCLNEEDSLEGAGAGIALILFLLKGLHVSFNHIKYEITDHQQVLTTLEIPLDI